MSTFFFVIYASNEMFLKKFRGRSKVRICCSPFFQFQPGVWRSIPTAAVQISDQNCALRVLKHTCRRCVPLGLDIRVRSFLRETPADDNRFTDSLGRIQAIATSHDPNDSGMFELNF